MLLRCGAYGSRLTGIDLALPNRGLSRCFRLSGASVAPARRGNRARRPTTDGSSGVPPCNGVDDIFNRVWVCPIRVGIAGLPLMLRLCYTHVFRGARAKRRCRD